MTTHPDDNSTDDGQSLQFDPQTHYKHPWPRAWTIWTCFNMVIIIFMLIALLAPENPGTPFVVSYMMFAISGGGGLIIFLVIDPSIGVFQKTHRPRISGDKYGDSAVVPVYSIRPLFGLKRCEQIGGRQSRIGGVGDYNEPYGYYSKLFGKGVCRVRWEPALFVVGSGEAQDRTDLIWHGTTLVTRQKQCQRRRDDL